MILKGIIEEDFINYKNPSLFLGFPSCSFKCEKESGVYCCQNSILATTPNIEVSIEEIIARYLSNPITTSVTLGGLEPLDSFTEVISLIKLLREKTNDAVVVYTGYEENEVREQLSMLKQYKNIIVKFGRFMPNNNTIFDKTLGVTLASSNQYAKKIS